MFKATVAEFVIALLMTAIGVLAAIYTSATWLIGAGMLVAGITIFNGWKILDSTVKLLEVEARQRGWQQLP
jgi:hypothetical protein